MEKLRRTGAVGVVVGVMCLLTSASAAATAPPPSEPSVPPSTPASEPVDIGSNDDAGDGLDTPTTEAPDITLPLVPVPPGCNEPETPRAVFLGTVIDKDYRTVRFRIDTLRSGDPAPFATDNLVDLRYGLDAQYLDVGEQYLVGAVVDPVLGVLASRVTPPIEDFGGDEVIGLSETDADCPEYEDVRITLWPDGSGIDGGVLDPLKDSKAELLGAVLIPIGLAVGAIFILALLRNGGKLAWGGVRAISSRSDNALR